MKNWTTYYLKFSENHGKEINHSTVIPGLTKQEAQKRAEELGFKNPRVQGLCSKEIPTGNTVVTANWDEAIDYYSVQNN